MRRSGTFGIRLGAAARKVGLLVAVFGAAVAGGCALVYNFDYSSGSTSTSGAGGASASSGQSSVSGSDTSGSSSGNNSSSVSGSSSSKTSTSSNTSASSSSSGGGTVPDATWQMQYGGGGNSRAGHPGIDMGPSPALNVFITGTFMDMLNLGNMTLNQSGTNFFLAKISPATGNALWSIALGPSNNDLSSVAATHDGGVVVAGSATSPLMLACMMPSVAFGNHDIFIAKFDSAGACQWHHEYGDAQDQFANTVVALEGGQIYLAGSFKGTFTMGGANLSTPAGSEAAFVAKFDNAGTPVWAQQFGDNAHATTLARLGNPNIPASVGIAVGGTFTGTINLGGGKTLSSMNPTPYVVSFSDNQVPLNAVSFPGADIVLGDDPLAFTGGALVGVTSAGAPNSNMAIGDLDNDGSVTQIPKSLSGTTSGTMESITRHTTGVIFMTGFFNNGPITFGIPIQPSGGNDIFIGRLDKFLMPVAGRGYGDASPQYGRNIRSDEGGHLYVFGDFQGTVDFGKGQLMSPGNTSLFLVKYDPAIL